MHYFTYPSTFTLIYETYVSKGYKSPFFFHVMYDSQADTSRLPTGFMDIQTPYFPIKKAPFTISTPNLVKQKPAPLLPSLCSWAKQINSLLSLARLNPTTKEQRHFRGSLVTNIYTLVQFHPSYINLSWHPINWLRYIWLDIGIQNIRLVVVL